MRVLPRPMRDSWQVCEFKINASESIPVADPGGILGSHGSPLSRLAILSSSIVV